MSQNAGLDQAWTFITTRDYKMIAILQLSAYYSDKKKTLHFNKIHCIKLMIGKLIIFVSVFLLIS